MLLAPDALSPPHHHHSPPPAPGDVWSSSLGKQSACCTSSPRVSAQARVPSRNADSQPRRRGSSSHFPSPARRARGAQSGWVCRDGGWRAMGRASAGAGSCRQDLEPQGQNAGLIQGIAEKEEGEKKGNQRSRGRRRPREKMRRKKKQKCLGPSGQEWAAHPFPGFTLLLLALPPAGASRQDVSLSLGAASQQNVSVL